MPALLMLGPVLDMNMHVIVSCCMCAQEEGYNTSCTQNPFLSMAIKAGKANI